MELRVGMKERTMSISVAPCSMQWVASLAFISELMAPKGNPTTQHTFTPITPVRLLDTKEVAKVRTVVRVQGFQGIKGKLGEETVDADGGKLVLYCLCAESVLKSRR